MKRDGHALPTQRVALAHDWLTGMRGGEKVLELLCRRFPDAPLWTLIHNPNTVSPTIANRRIHTSILQKLPFAGTRYRNYLPFFPFFAEMNKASHAEVVISTSHAVAKSMVKRGNGHCRLHICYIHTPIRYAWDLFDDYFGPERVGRFKSRFVFKPLLQWVRWYDRATVDRVDLFIANSTYVAERVRRCYGRPAAVLPPPVDMGRFAIAGRDPQDWYLVVSAMVPYKRVDQAIRACASLGRRLKIVGSGPEESRLRQLAGKLRASVDFVGFASDEEVVEYYSHARALIFPGVEDFGIVPVEAIATGCPVIAFKKGGVLDSMTDQTATFYSQQTADCLTDAIREFEATESRFAVDVLRSHAERFSEEEFLNGFEILLQSARGRTSNGGRRLAHGQ
jgi:glycosyltransferase involved in cell wall biosynthesis